MALEQLSGLGYGPKALERTFLELLHGPRPRLRFMGDRFNVQRIWRESDLVGVGIYEIWHVEVEDTRTDEIAEGTGWSEDEAVSSAISHLSGSPEVPRPPNG